MKPLRRRPERDTPQPTPAELWVRQSYADEAGDAPRPRRVHRVALGALGGAVLVAAGAGITAAREEYRHRTVPASGPATVALTGPRIISDDPTLCLAATAERDGAPLTLRPCDASATQRLQAAADGTVRLGDRCLTVAGRGPGLHLARCTGARAQRFDAGGGRLVSAHTGGCVDVAGPRLADGAGIVVRACGRTTARTWWPA